MSSPRACDLEKPLHMVNIEHQVTHTLVSVPEHVGLHPFGFHCVEGMAECLVNNQLHCTIFLRVTLIDLQARQVLSELHDQNKLASSKPRFHLIHVQAQAHHLCLVALGNGFLQPLDELLAIWHRSSGQINGSNKIGVRQNLLILDIQEVIGIFNVPGILCPDPCTPQTAKLGSINSFVEIELLVMPDLLEHVPACRRVVDVVNLSLRHVFERVSQAFHDQSLDLLVLLCLFRLSCKDLGILLLCKRNIGSYWFCSLVSCPPLTLRLFGHDSKPKPPYKTRVDAKLKQKHCKQNNQSHTHTHTNTHTHTHTQTHKHSHIPLAVLQG